ncbi:MAG: DUF6754 domain-containing protein [Candidatus Edwardsbacteria bacterium]
MTFILRIVSIKKPNKIVRLLRVSGSILLTILFTQVFFVFALDPPKNVKVTKIVNNDSISITIGWEKSKDERIIDGYQVLRSKYILLGSLVQDSVFIDQNLNPKHEYQYDVIKKEVIKVPHRINSKTKIISWHLPQKALGFTDIEILKDRKRYALPPTSQSEFKDELYSPNSRYKVRAVKVVSIIHKVAKDTTNGKQQNILRWKRPNELYLGEIYEVWRTDKEGEYEPIGFVKFGISSYKDTTMKDGVRYYYKVASIKGTEKSFSKASERLFTIGTPKCMIAEDIPDDEGKGFRITWEPSPNADEIKNYLLLRLGYDSLASFKDIFIYTDTTAKPQLDYRYYIGKSYQITMPATIVSDSMGMTGRVIKLEWKINPKVIGQSYDLTLIYRAEKDSANQFKYVDFTAPNENKFIDGIAEPKKEYIYEARAVKEISIPFRITEDKMEKEKRRTTLVWNPSREPKEFMGYVVNRTERDSGSYGVYARLGREVNKFQDRLAIFNGIPYAYRLVAITKNNEKVFSQITPYVIASPQWFHKGRINALISLVIFVFLVVFFMELTKRGKELFIRRISGLSAIDETVGRATEMGRPILYVPGTSDITDVATIASLNILSEVAKKAAQSNTPLIVPNRDPIVFTVAREVVKEAYNKVGRPDAYNPDSVYFVTDSQFAYAAAVDGIMLREKPAANFLVGMFWAESLIMAETGSSTGAIQIAGTDAVTQLPFFITACDYTLIGEELYAASAYISKNPSLLAALKSQDYGKMVIVIVMVIATIIALLKLGLPVFNLFNIY